MGRPLRKKKDIEDAAIRLFATKGLARTVIKDIAREAHVTEGALYKHYSSKNQMAWELFTRELTEFSTAFDKILSAKNDDFKTRISQGISFIYNYYNEHPVKFSFILLTQHGFPEENLLDEKLNPNDMVIRFVKNFADTHSIRYTPIILAGMIMGLVLQPIIMHHYGRLEKHPIFYLGDITNACICLLEQSR